MVDGRRMDWNEVRIPRDPACPVCGATHTAGAAT